MRTARCSIAFVVIAAMAAACTSVSTSTAFPTGQPGDTSGAPTSGPSGSATPAPTGEQPVTLVYTGTLTEHRISYSNPTEIGLTRDLEMSWTYTYTGPLTFDASNLPSSGHREWTSVEVSGSLLQIGYDGFGVPDIECSA